MMYHTEGSLYRVLYASDCSYNRPCYRRCMDRWGCLPMHWFLFLMSFSNVAAGRGKYICSAFYRFVSYLLTGMVNNGAAF
jgi:hypothetical protein